MDELTRIFEEATLAIEKKYMEFPICGSMPIYRERVYCYELYHQLRKRWPTTSPFTLNGEVDKRGHGILRNLGASDYIPDLLVHIPGKWEGNHAIIEVKHANANPSGIRKDIMTLRKFCNTVHYKRAIYLFYGGIPSNVKEISKGILNLPPIELWLHEKAGEPAKFVETLQTEDNLF